MATATIHETKTHLSKLLRRLALGEDIIILNGSTPVAKLVPIPHHKPRVPGSLKGLYKTPDSFFDPLPSDELDIWESAS